MALDIATNVLMQKIETPTLTLLSKFISYALDPVVLIIVSLLIATYLYVKVSQKKGIIFAGTMLATGALVKLLKEIFQRARPLNGLIPETSFAMPSGHATIAVVFFGLITYLFINKKYKIFATIITLLIVLITGFTRIYLRVHWLTDILAGFILGLVILVGSMIVYKRFPNLMP